MDEDIFARASGMAANSVLTRLLVHLTEAGMLPREAGIGILTDAEVSMRDKHTVFADGAVGIIQNVLVAYREAFPVERK